MSKREPTAEQRAAIDAAGEVLVSASAGSGKTFVMIEKIISLILRGEADVSSVLAVTFTNLAAGEMKERLRAALVARINEESGPARSRLKVQLAEIATADISTLHSFCTNVIRRYFYRSDAAGNFRVADEAEAAKIRLRAVDLVFDRLLEEKDEDFALLCRIFADGRGFGRLRDVLLRSYGRTVVQAGFESYLRALPALYDEAHFDALAAELFAPVRARAQRLAEACARLQEEAEPYFTAGVFGEKHAAFLRERAAFGADVAACADLFAAAPLAARELGRKPSNAAVKRSGSAFALELDGRMAALKEEVDGIKKALEGAGERQEALARFLAAGRPAAALCGLLLAFDAQYATLKTRAGVLDFADLERKCLQLLEDEDVRREVAGRYTHVFVDEYQDINPVQERILSLVSGGNVFMVGDAKQSIYGFRGCSARFFAQKFDGLRPQGRALTLNGNFRSATAVLDAVNAVFSEVMTAETGGVDYAATSVMRAGGDAPRGTAHIVFVPERVGEEPEARERGVYSVAEHLSPEDEEFGEGAAIAALAEQKLAEGYTYGDIVVLVRSKRGRAERIVAELARRGLPVSAEAEVNVCDYPEVKAVIGILQYLDNAAQDIPLACALKSALGSFTDGELAAVRLAAGQGETFRDACARYAREKRDGTAAKLRAFYAACDKLRLLCSVESAAAVMTHILSATGMEGELLALPCGAERVRRVGRLIAESGELSVPEFLEALKSGGYFVGFSESGGENAVRVMTMHASKGLEFPVVIVAGMNAPFNKEDLSGILYDDEWGFAFPAYDLENFVGRETLLRSVLKARIRRRRAADEMRILYVALTRAQRELYLVFTQDKPFRPERVAEAGCFAAFIDLDRSRDLVRPVSGGQTEPPRERVLAVGESDGEARRAVLARYRVPYPHADALGLPVKTSPTAYAAGPGEPAATAAEEDGPFSPPADPETGTAYHAFLERADFSAPPAAEAARLYEAMTAEGMEGLDRAKMQSILEMPVFASFRGKTLWRERAFLLSLPACELYDTRAEDGVLVQGVVDVMAFGGEECLLVDYKYSSLGPEALLQKYAPQLAIYAAAARRLPGVKKVTACLVNILRGYRADLPEGTPVRPA